MTRLRCAIYTRKSSEEGLEQDFNSLDAQRESCEAYIASQAGEGWRLIRTRYDDGAWSGSTMDRPALQRLLADIAAGKVDTVVVYKVDRLTRALADFAKMVELFDAHGVSFVSVTQQFNTTTSMGRLTLNVLLSFAQFEREVTAERIRDKIAASKRKGMWMGGVVPLGYDVIDRKLILNEPEAQTVRMLFRFYRQHANVRLVKEEADRLDLRTKARSPNNGKRQGGEPFSPGHLYKLLSNPVYIGEIVHKGERHVGQHEAIIDRETWDAVNERLKRNAVQRRSGGNARTPSLLAGLLFNADGNRMAPSHASKAGRRYRYYVSKPDLQAPGSARGSWRLPAPEIERVVLDGIGRLLCDRLRLIEGLGLSNIAPSRLDSALADAACLADRIVGSDPVEQRQTLFELLNRIDIGQDRVRIGIRTAALLSMIGEGSSREEDPMVTTQTERLFTLELPVSFKRLGTGMKLIIMDDRDRSRAPDRKLIAAVARGREWFAEIRNGGAASVTELSKRYAIDRTDIGRTITFALLAPDIIEAIVNGSQPPELTAARLKRVRDLPVSWAEQRRLLGFGR